MLYSWNSETQRRGLNSNSHRQTQEGGIEDWGHVEDMDMDQHQQARMRTLRRELKDRQEELNRLSLGRGYSPRAPVAKKSRGHQSTTTSVTAPLTAPVTAPVTSSITVQPVKVCPVTGQVRQARPQSVLLGDSARTISSNSMTLT